MLNTRTFVCLLGLVVLLGCQKDDGPAKSPVSGQVTLDGTPLAEGQISFMPSNGVGISTGGKITDGSYRVDVPLGEMRVEIRAPKKVGEKSAYDAPDSPKMPIFEEKIPVKYNANSELKTTVAKRGKQSRLQAGNTKIIAPTTVPVSLRDASATLQRVSRNTCFCEAV